MARSPAFARLQRDLLRLIDAVPPGRLVTQEALGEVLDIPPRHVAYLLATLNAAQQQQHPWHRVVGRAGAWKHRHAGGAQRLQAEGFTLQRDAVVDAERHTVDARTLGVTHEVPERPAVYRREAGGPALSEARGIGPRSLALLERLGITTLPALKASDPIDLYARARVLQPDVSLNLLYALVGAIEDRDWRDVARQDRTSLLMVLDERGLLR
ncbi:MAG: TfoX/Sxy family DNA transformation protein [Rubrivivax sp.]|jgi:DNA transformation protein